MRRNLEGNFFGGSKRWSGRPDLNRGPHAPQACALPDCATPRPHYLNQGYHLDSSSVKKLRSPSRKSSSIFLLNCVVGASPRLEACTPPSPASPTQLANSFKCRRAPAIVNPS